MDNDYRPGKGLLGVEFALRKLTLGSENCFVNTFVGPIPKCTKKLTQGGYRLFMSSQPFFKDYEAKQNFVIVVSP